MQRLESHAGILAGGHFVSWLYLPVFVPLLCGSGVERLDKAHFMDALIKLIPSMAAYLSQREENDAR